MEAREYFEKEYGHEHIEDVVGMGDWVSLYSLMDEFAEWKVKNCNTPLVSVSALEQIIKSDSVYTLLRYGNKSPSSSGVDDCDDSDYMDLYDICCELRKH